MRLTDVEYIQQLEKQMKDMQRKAEDFIYKMDKALVVEKDVLKLAEVYTDNIKLIQP